MGSAGEGPLMPADEVLAVTLQVTEALEALGVVHLVGGSLASSLHGIPRATQDADIVARLREEHVDALGAALKDDFYLDTWAMTKAIRSRRSFNLIHLRTMFKIDVFVPGDDPMTEAEFGRRQTIALSGMPGKFLAVASPEDTVLQKLLWYRKGEEASERQWRDVLGVLKIQGPKLDRDYLRAGAERAGVTDLLERALSRTPDI